MDREILCKAKRVRYGDYIIGGILMIDEKKLLEKLRIYISDYAKPPYGREVEGTVELLKEAADAIEALSDKPEVDYDGEWIPCSERLPKKDGFYLATIDGEIAGVDKSFTGLAEFENGKWIDDEGDYKPIIAWQPLPEPYKETGGLT